MFFPELEGALELPARRGLRSRRMPWRWILVLRGVAFQESNQVILKQGRFLTLRAFSMWYHRGPERVWTARLVLAHPRSDLD